MGLDLTLLPAEAFKVDKGKLWGFSHTMLRLSRDYNLWSHIKEVKSVSLDSFKEVDFTCFLSPNKDGESSYGQLTKTPYGDPLKFVKADDLLKAMKECHAVESLMPWNAAAMNFLKEIPPDTMIGLYWH